MEVELIKAKSPIKDSGKYSLKERLRVAAYCRVSTDKEDQISSYKSQVDYYTDLIKKKKEWALADIYADEAITGTQVTKRGDFQRMINDCMNGDIDMIITKAISRFARNTLDTLKYVRMLKEKNIAVYFEDENINTLTMDGELLLVVLSSVAQQEVENISGNVKKGLKMKMKRGELVGFQGCLGYDYHVEDKSITVNHEGAEIVRYIFERYVDGAGAGIILRELNDLGYRTMKDNKWTASAVIGIIKNEKYKGDILLGKSFTVDSISKRRLSNRGEEDQYYIKKHHEPIISEETFDKAQEILQKRSYTRKRGAEVGKREKYSRQYAFSCKLECGFCGSNLSRRSWHAGTLHQKTIWQCVTSTKKGKQHCTHSKGIPEKVIEDAFIESYRILSCNNKDILEEFIARIEKTLSDSTVEKELNKIDKEIHSVETKRKRLVDMRLEDSIDKSTYEDKYMELDQKQKKLLTERIDYQGRIDNEKSLNRRTREFKKTLEGNEVLLEFDRGVFESIVEKVIVGEIDEDGNINPYKLTFVYKTGISNKIDGDNKKPPKTKSTAKDKLEKMSSFISTEVENLSSYISGITR